MRMLRVREVCNRIGLCRSSIYRMMDDGRFPRSVKLGVGEMGAVAWVEEEVEAWLEEKVARRDSK